MKQSKIFIQLAIVVGIILVINLISSKMYLRLDFTADKRYTLSKATKNILEDLDDVVTVKAYFSEDLPPQLIRNRKDFEDLLVEYENRSDGNLVYEFISPNEDEEIEREAMQNGIQPLIINVTEKDQVQQLKAFMGAVLTMGDRTEVIGVVQPGASMEYDLTTAIKKVSLTDKPKIALIEGHGEPSVGAIGQLNQQLSVLYEVETYNLSDSSSVPPYYRALMIINPSDTISSAELSALDAYMKGGGAVFIAFANVKGDLQTSQLSPGDKIGLQSWLSKKGIELGSDFVVDQQCAPVSVRQQTGFGFMMTSQVQFPYFPILSGFSDHPITKGLESVFLPFTNSITITSSDSSMKVTNLMMTSEKTGFVSAPSRVDVQRRWRESDFQRGSQPVAVAVSGKIGDAANSKMVIVSNGQFLINGEGQGRQQLSPDNINFAANAVDWISDESGLVDLRTKGVTNRPLEQLEDGERNFYKYGNVFAPILLVLIYAFIRKQRNMKKKQNWLQGKY